MMASSRTTIETCYAQWSENYFEEYYGKNAPYPPVHVKLIVEALRQHGARTVLDAGCGPASILRTLVELGFVCDGFDLTPEMVAQAQRVMQEMNVPVERIWQGDTSDASAYRKNGFDAAIAIGVLPHLKPAQVEATFQHLHRAVRPDGLVIVQARNALFSLFTMNRNTHEFVRDELLRVDAVEQDDERALAMASLAQLEAHVRMDLPANRMGAGYDDTQPRAENPLVLPEQFAACGFTDVDVMFYHYHAAPPMCETIDPQKFRDMSVTMEKTCGPRNWRGYFMASSFLVVGVRP